METSTTFKIRLVILVFFVLLPYVTTLGGEKSSNPSPPDGGQTDDPSVILSWTSGEGAVLHHVYFGTDYDAVLTDDMTGTYRGAITQNNYQLELLPMGIYYWRIDEVVGAGSGAPIFKGDVWSFTVGGVPGITYVDADAPGPIHNGTSWANAYKYLQDALLAASDGDEIWVAEGYYYPDRDTTYTSGTGFRTATFQLKSGVELYGGFAGSETSRDQRNWQTNITILTGDLSGNDAEVMDPSSLLDELTRAENSYHVVTGSGCDETAILSGFTITGGNANDSYLHCAGGGMFVDHGGCTLTDCTFIGNSAVATDITGSGGGVYSYYSDLTINKCTFSGNLAASSGGGVSNVFSSVTLTECSFTGNSAGGGGGLSDKFGSFMVVDSAFSGNYATAWAGAFHISSHGEVIRCEFTGNSTDGDGGATYNSIGNPLTMTDCTFTGNTAGGDAGAICRFSGAITNCSFSRNSAGGSGGGIFNSWDGLTLTNCKFIDDNSATLGGGMYNKNFSPTLINCTFSGNSADDGGGMYNDNGGPTLTNCPFNDNSATRGGGMYNNSSRPTLINCTFSGNSADDGGGLYNYSEGPTLINCTISGNEANWGGGMYNDFSSDPTLTNCILWGTGQIFGFATVTYSDIQGGWPGTGNINIDPHFQSGTLRLSADSPCINVGDNSALPVHVTTDLDGNPRIVHGVVDMGAYESPYPPNINTPIGIDVETQPVDETTGTTPVTVTFAGVTRAGVTTLTTTDSGPTPPTGFYLAGTHYDISTSAIYDQPVTICIQYDDTGMTLEEEQALTLYHFEDGDWVPVVPCTVNTDTNTVCGTVTSFSLFALFLPDVTPPEIIISANPDVLWPANHKMVEVLVEVEATDNSDSELDCGIVWVRVVSNEPINGPGDGNTDPDWDWDFTDDPLVVLLRAECAGGGDGRVYTIWVQCTYAAGNSTFASVDVNVPHDQGNTGGKGKKK